MRLLKLFARGAAHAAVTDITCSVILRDTVRQEYSLGESGELRHLYGPAFIAVVGDLDKDVPLIVGAVIIAVDDAHGIIELQPVFKAET